MRTDGPEFQRGWRGSFDVDGATAIVDARHIDRSRMPTGHEYARQAMSGRPHGMVRMPVYEWSVRLREVHAAGCTIRPTVSGQFEVAGTRRVHRTLEEAVRSWAMPQVARAAEARAMREAAVDGDFGPRP